MSDETIKTAAGNEDNKENPTPTIMKKLPCAMVNCGITDCKFRCSSCNNVFYCSPEHQKSDWKKHRPICNCWKESRIGYPNQPLVKVHTLDQSDLKPMSVEEMAVMFSKIHILFSKQRGPGLRASQVGSHVSMVNKDNFMEQFRGLTQGIFEEWGSDQWDHVLIAGGAVLASILPVDPHFACLARGFVDPSWVEFNFGPCGANGRPVAGVQNTLAKFMQEVRWPYGDIDLFIHSVSSAEEAGAKLKEILVTLRKKIKLTFGVDKDVVFCKTTNTVTIIAPPLRKIQIITRVYGNKHDILNSFDIDCCCIGWDGSDVLTTQRCLDAVRTKVNVVNLSIRGEAYENRLLKYATRGFGIGVPELKANLSLIDGAWVRIPVETTDYGGDKTMDGDGWSRWAGSSNLSRLLMADYLAGKLVIIQTPFVGRRRKAKDRDFEAAENIKHHFIVAPGAVGAESDSYPWNDKSGQPISPSTTLLPDAAGGKFRVEWRFGNMPRKPLTFVGWSEEAFQGAKRKSDDDWRQAYEERRRKQAEEKQKADELLAMQRAAERAAELSAMEKEAEKRAQKKLQQRTRELDQEKDAVEAQKKAAAKEIEQAQKQLEKAEALRNAAQIKENEAKAAAAAAEQARNDTDEQRMCVVCWVEPKCIMLDPCKHVCLCTACFDSVKASTARPECPMCRKPISKGEKLYL